MKKIYTTLSLVAALGASGLASAQNIVISGWGGNDVVVMNKLINEVLAEDFKAAKINIKYVPVEGDFTPYIVNALSAGTAPDLFYTDVLVVDSLVKSGKLAANSPELVKLQKDMVPSLNTAFTNGGKQYGIAKDFNTLAIQFNKDIFDEAKVAYPSNTDTWEDLQDKLKKVKAKLGKKVSGICLMPDYARFAPFALSTGWSPFNAQGKTVLDANFKRAFEFYTGLVQEGVGIVSSDVGQNWGGGCLGTEKTAASIEGNWISGYLRDKAPNMAYGSAMMPLDKKTGKRGNLLFTVAWGVNGDGKNLAQARKAVEILTSEKAQAWVLDSGLALPSRTKLGDAAYLKKAEAENVLAKNVFDGANNGFVQPYSFGAYGSAWTTPINEALNAVLLKQMGAKEALAVAQAKYDKLVTK